jgi:lipoate---protein ligase
MKFVSWILDTPAGNLAAEEALLDSCEESGDEVLRIWESPVPFVVVGYGNRVAHEVDVEACERNSVPILRRCSGGGTVVQGPGCLCYALVLQGTEGGPVGSVTAANRHIMERNCAALAAVIQPEIAVQGCTDLALRANGTWLKFSGNSQRRRRRSFLFHGTILYAFDLSIIPKLLRMPSAEPGYRASRSHESFVTNAPLTREIATQALRRAWNADADLPGLPIAAAEELTRQRYGTNDWNRSR